MVTRAAAYMAEALEDRVLLSTFAHINFQLPGTTVFPGYLVDSGLPYGDRGNGFTYGWLTAPSGTPSPTNDPATRDRGAGISPDKRWDTLDHFHKAGQSPVDEANKVANPTWWQISLPNGTYQIRVVAGDPSNVDETFIMYAQASKTASGVPIVATADQGNLPPGFTGTLLFNKVAGAAAADHWADSGVVNVNVTDGTLYISEAAEAVNNKICFIDIDTTNVITVPNNPTNLAVTSTAASKVGLSWTDNSTNENGFRVEQSLDGTTWTTVNTTSPNVTTYTVTGLNPQTKYYYRVFAFNATGDSAQPTNIVNTTTLAATGTVLSLFQTTAAGDVNLTTEGTLDWAHWGLTDANSFDHKTVATHLISDVTSLAGSPKVQGTTSAQTFTWSDGTPTASAAASPNVLGTFGYFHGYSFTVPADTTTRVLRVYVGVRNFRGQIRAQLSDGSAADAVDSSLFSSATADGVYSIAYKAASAGQTLTVTWQVLPPDGDVTDSNARIYLKAATVQPPPPPPTGTAVNVTATALVSGRVGLNWTDQSNGAGYIIERAPDVAGSPGTFAQVGQTFNPATFFLDQGTLGVTNTKYYYRLTPINTASVVGTASSIVPVTTVATVGDGAQATYFNAPDLINPNATNPTLGTPWPVSSIDPTINFNFANNAANPNAPAGAGAGFPNTNYAVRWTANIKPDFTEMYTFYADTDDGYRIIVNGLNLLDHMEARRGLGTVSPSTPIQLTAGQTYSLVFDMDQAGGGAGARLYWSSPSLAREIVPQASMYHVPPDLTPPKVTGIQVDGQLPAGAAYTSAQHVIITFNENMGNSIDGSDITIIGALGNGYSGAQIAVAFDPASNSAILTFPSDILLPDDNYTITITGATVSDASGNPLDGNGDGTGGDDFVGKFYVLTGDTHEAYNGSFNNDRKVSFIDFQRLELGFGKGAAQRVSNADGDFNHDGVVDSLDVAIFNQKLGQTLPPAPAAPVGAPAPAPVAVKTSKTPVKPTPKPVKKVSPPALNVPPGRSTFATKRPKGVGDWLASN